MLALEHLVLAQGSFRLSAHWSVPAGARVAVIGPSGSGKSTLLMGIAGFLAPAAGRILWDGRDLAGIAPGDRPLSVLFQDQNLFPHLTVAQNAGLGLSPALRLTAGDRARVAAVLDRLGIADLADRRPAAISGGQAGRAALARAILRARPLLLLDEPFAALGPAMKADLLDLVSATAAGAGTTVLMVTHDPGEARRFADLTVFVEGGSALPPAPTAALLDAPPARLAAYLGRGRASP